MVASDTLRALLLLACGLAPARALASDVPVPSEGTPLDKFFRGAVVGLDGTKVRLKYDFSTPDQMKDWSQGVPWPIATDSGDAVSLDQGRLAVRGSVGTKHVAEWEGDVLVTCKLIPDGTKDIGAYLSSPEQVNDYVTYTIAETFFHGWDKEGTGGDSGIMKFGKQFSVVQHGGYVGFRYLDFRRPLADPTPGKAIAWSFGRKGASLLMSMDDLKLDSMEPGNRLKVLQVGFYAIKSSVLVDDVVIEGTLHPRYLAAKKLALKTEKPIVPEAPAGADPAVQALLDAYAKGKEGASKLVQIVGDPARGDADRLAAVAALKAGPRKALPSIVDLLYNADVKARTLGIEIVKAMTGKTYGYEPKAGEKARQMAVRRLNEDLAAHPELLQGGGG